jgi:hypothetical protein
VAIEPKLIATGSGWRVYRLGRSFCVSLDRPEKEPLEVWLNTLPNDITRGALLGALVAGAHGAVDHRAATEAMGADW